MDCRSCYPLSQLTVKLINTKKYFNNVNRNKCNKCNKYYITKGERKHAK